MDVQDLQTQYQAGTRNFIGVDLREANLQNCNLSGANLERGLFSVTNFSNANLSRTQLRSARLNVARLTGANLSKANLEQALLNVANLIQADLRYANLREALVMRAELIRSQLNEANFLGSNLSGSDLRECLALHTCFERCNLGEANLQGAICSQSNFQQAMLKGANLSGGDFQGANFQNTELRQTNLSKANLQGANLQGANLRWANLSGANLEGADLSQAKLSGANLSGANLRQANLRDASLVHADLTNVCLMDADWSGCDLTGVNLTGAKVYGVARFGLNAKEVQCDWLDLSPGGDRQNICQFTPQTLAAFFQATQPKVVITVDCALSMQAHLDLANVYLEMSCIYSEWQQPPNIAIVNRRQTILEFLLNTDEELLNVLYLAIMPFGDRQICHGQIQGLLRLLEDNAGAVPENTGVFVMRQLVNNLYHALNKLIGRTKVNYQTPSYDGLFFRSPLQVQLVNSQNQTLTLYTHALFRRTNSGQTVPGEGNLPPLANTLKFMETFIPTINAAS